MEEQLRLQNLFQLERALQANGNPIVAGVDEVGRGPLAGPVMAAACILPHDLYLAGLNDSKKCSEKKRIVLREQIQAGAIDFAIGSASVEEIDQLNILQATKLAMARAVEGLRVKPDILLVDGRDPLNIAITQRNVIDGDAQCACIAAASILAKVARDEQMVQMHSIYPEYHFDLHKGYGTRLHLNALEKFGPCAIHRRSFSPVKERYTIREDHYAS